MTRRPVCSSFPSRVLLVTWIVSSAMASAQETTEAVPEPTQTDTVSTPPAPPSPPDTRLPAPDPSQGETYDGRVHKPTVGQGFLWVPRIFLFPLRLVVWALEPTTRVFVELEQRHHLYNRMNAVFTSDDGQVGLRPTFTWMRSFRPAGGIHVFHNRLFGPGTKAELDVVGGIDVVEAAGRIRPTRLGSRVNVYVDSIYSRRNDWLFGGIGTPPPFPDGSQTRYQMDRFDQAVRLDLRPIEALSFTFGGYFGWRRFANGEAYSGDGPISQTYCVRVAGVCVPGTVDEAQVPGFNQDTQFLRGAMGIHLDLRDNRVRPTVGVIIRGEADYSHGLGSDDSSYFRVRGRAGVIFNLWRHSHLLVIHGATEVVLPVHDSIVPFSELTTLGGPDDMRGFRRDTFRDYSTLIGSAEYRWPVLQWVEASLFADYGGAFGQKYQGFGSSRMRPDVGFGFRVHSRDKFFVKMQVAYGWDGGWQIFLTGQNLP